MTADLLSASKKMNNESKTRGLMINKTSKKRERKSDFSLKKTGSEGP